jgi:antitoxin YefM
MAIETTYTRARATLKALLEEASASREPVIIRRRDGDDVALIALDELQSLMETAHLLRSPRNGERLLKALVRARQGKGAADDLRPHYDFDYTKSRPNRFAAKIGDDAVAVVLDADVASVFRSSEAVNTFLRSAISAMPKDAGSRKRRAS